MLHGVGDWGLAAFAYLSSRKTKGLCPSRRWPKPPFKTIRQMYLPIHTSFRGLVLAALLVLGLGTYVWVQHSRPKADYSRLEGKITYLAPQYQQWPVRHRGDFRYLIVDSYPLAFEIYLPNSRPGTLRLDDLKPGDLVEVYYFESPDPPTDGLNKFAQFIDQQGEAVFVRNDFRASLGKILVGLAILLLGAAFWLWKKGSLAY